MQEGSALLLISSSPLRHPALTAHVIILKDDQLDSMHIDSLGNAWAWAIGAIINFSD
jgi:hypothetical protein